MNLPKYTRSDYIGILLCSLFVLLGLFMREGGEIDWAVYFFAALFLIFLFAPLIRAQIKKTKEKRKEWVTFDKQRIKKTAANKTEQQILWCEIAKISISATYHGPFSNEVYWIISGINESPSVVISNDAEGLLELVEAFQDLPTFDHKKALEAIWCTSSVSFVLWQGCAEQGA